MFCLPLPLPLLGETARWFPNDWPFFHSLFFLASALLGDSRLLGLATNEEREGVGLREYGRLETREDDRVRRPVLRELPPR